MKIIFSLIPYVYVILVSFGIEEEDDNGQGAIGTTTFNAANHADNAGLPVPKNRGKGLVLDHGLVGDDLNDNGSGDYPVTN